MTTLYDEMYDAYLGEGNHERITFGDWLDDMAENPQGTLQDAARKLRRQLCETVPGLITACENMAFSFDDIKEQQGYPAALGYFWFLHGQASEGRSWCEAALAR